MRMSTAQMFQQGINSILTQQSQAQKTQLQISNGERLLTPSDDPAATQQIMNLNQSLAIQDQHQLNLEFAASGLAQTENVIDGVENAIQRIRELVIQANSGSQSDETRAIIATEIEGLISETVSLGNTKDQNNQYIFAGYSNTTQPFGQSAAGVSYQGDGGSREVQVGLGQSVVVQDSGERVFMQVPNGNGKFQTSASSTNAGDLLVGATSVNSTFTSGNYQVSFVQASVDDPISYMVTDASAGVIASGAYQSGMTLEFAGHQLSLSGTPADGDQIDIEAAVKTDIFTRMDSIVEALRQPVNSSVGANRLSNELARSLESIDEAAAHFSNYRSELGVRMNYLDNQQEMNGSFTLHLQSSLSEVKDLDYTEAITRLNLQLTGLEAAQQVYVRVQGLSLFNYI